MARTFRRHRAAHPLSELNVTNLVDLAFVLLLIFMIATPLITQEQSIAVNLPNESTKPQAKPDPNQKFITITIDGQGRYYLDRSPVSFRELAARLAEYGREPENRRPAVRLRADRQQRLQEVISVMDELTKNQLTKFAFDTKTSD